MRVQINSSFFRTASMRNSLIAFISEVNLFSQNNGGTDINIIMINFHSLPYHHKIFLIVRISSSASINTSLISGNDYCAPASWNTSWLLSAPITAVYKLNATGTRGENSKYLRNRAKIVASARPVKQTGND